MVLEGFNQGDVASYSIEETELDDAPWFRVLYGPFERALGSVKAEFNSQGVTDAWWIRRELEEAPMIAADIEVISVIPVAFSMRRAPEDFGLHPDGRSDEYVRDGRAERANLDFENSMTRRQAVRTSSFYLLVLAFGLFVITIQVMLLQTVPMLTDAGYSRISASAMITVTSIPAFLSKPVWGWLIDGLRPKPLAATSAALTGISLFIIVYAIQSGSEIWAYTGFALLGFGWGGMIPLQEVIWASFFWAPLHRLGEKCRPSVHTVIYRGCPTGDILLL